MPHPSASAWRYGRPREGVPREVSNPEPTVVNELDIGQSPPIFRPGGQGLLRLSNHGRACSATSPADLSRPPWPSQTGQRLQMEVNHDQ